MNVSRKQIGETYAVSSELLWGLFPVITVLCFDVLTPVFSAALCTLAAGVFFAVVCTFLYTKKPIPLQKIKDALPDILLSTLFIGIFYFGLFFWGLQYTTAGNGSIVSLMEICFSFLILGLILRHEKVDLTHLIGAIFMIAGALFILLPKGSGYHIGDMFILLATAFPPFGNYFVQRARKHVPSAFIMLVRSVLGGLFLLGMAYAMEPPLTTEMLSNAWFLLAINGFLVMGLSKLFWIETIHHITISKAAALGTMAPFFTLVYAYLFLGEHPTLWQVTGFLPMLIGVALLTQQPEKHSLTLES